MIELQPNRAEGHLRLGNVLAACDEFQKVQCVCVFYVVLISLFKAKECYLTALKLEPGHDLTVEALRDMDTKRKMVHLRKAVASARAAFDARNFFEANALLSDCIELNPKNASYLVYRALVRCAQGDVEGAATDAARIVIVDSVKRKKKRVVSSHFFSELSSRARTDSCWILAKARWRSCCIWVQNSLFCVERAFSVVLQGANRFDPD